MIVNQLISGFATLILISSPVGTATTTAAKEPLTIDQKIVLYANEYGVDADVMINVLNCENEGLVPDQQSKNRYTKDHPEWGVKKGDRERSFGLSQIHLPSHPKVTYKQAVDPDYALDFLAKNLKTNPQMWSCYRKIYGV